MTDLPQPPSYPSITIDCADGEFLFEVRSLAHDALPPGEQAITIDLDPYHTTLHQANLLADAVREMWFRQMESYTGDKIERPAPLASTGPDQWVRSITGPNS